MRARNPAMVVAMAVGWCAKSSMTVTPPTVPRTSRRRLTPWKEASAYAAAEKWKEAAAIWHRLYDQARNWKVKARLASNIAVSEELCGNLSIASDWAERSYTHYLEYASVVDTTTLNRQRRYTEAMKQRLRSDKELRDLGK